MAKNSTKVALIYDFDGTLSTCDMQNYGLIPELGMKPKAFWKKPINGPSTTVPIRLPAACITLPKRPKKKASS